MKISKKLIIAISIVLAIVVIIGLSIPATVNGVIYLQESAAQKYSDIQTQLQRRNDLIPNLLSTLKAYMKFEEETYTKIAEASNKLSNAISEEDSSKAAEANEELQVAVKNIIDIANQKYPDLKASEQFTAFTDEWAGTENRIAYARNEYNSAVKAYNSEIKKFPTKLFISKEDFPELQYFKASPNAEEAPVANFD